ncbi:MAG TPA: acyltransferase [Myxococcales bacterium]|nr:acyltransferase [Myxococcales bacterium]
MSRGKAPLQIPSLDGIRAASFMLVFLAHSGLEEVVPGGLGVTTFFFLSGFLITTLMRKELEETGQVSFRHFYLRRALRILPPFYTVLLGAALLSSVGVLAGPPQLHPLLAQAFHFANYWTVRHGYDGQVGGTGVYWSLAVEEHFYLLFPMIFILLHRFLKSPRSRAAFLWAACLGILAWRCVLVFGADVIPNRTYLASDTRFDSILFGCALALVGNPALDPATETSRARWLRLGLPASVALMLGSLLFREPRFRETFRYSLQGLALYPLFICAVRNPQWGPFRLLNHPVARRIGALSYSLYLLHHVVIFGVKHWLSIHPLFQSLIAFAIAYALAETIWRFIEKPCARLRGRLTQRSPVEAAPVLAPAGSPQ